jgi:nucleotide-binding universal stress UspA family protein
MAESHENGTVLFAYDGSEQAKGAILEAARQLRPGRPAVVLSVFEPPAGVGVAGVPLAAPEIEAEFEGKADDIAREGADLARSLGFGATPVAASGQAIWQAIVETADVHDADILVLGSHGRTGIGLVLMGSVAAAVARHTERPVMIVHRRPAEARGPAPAGA